MSLPQRTLEWRLAARRQARRRLALRQAVRWCTGVALAVGAVWFASASGALALSRDERPAAVRGRLAPVEGRGPAPGPGNAPPAGRNPALPAARPPAEPPPAPARPAGPAGVQPPSTTPQDRPDPPAIRILQVLIRAVAMPVEILAEGLRPGGQPNLARVLLALWSGTGLAGPLLPDGPAQSATDLIYSSGDGLHALAARFLEHAGATERALAAAGVPGSRWLAWAVTVRQAVGLGWHHALDFGGFLRSLRPGAILDAVLAARGNWALMLGRVLGLASGGLGILLGGAAAVTALRRRRRGELDGFAAAVRVISGLLTALGGVLAIVALVAAAPGTAAGAAFLSLVLGMLGLLLESRPVSRWAAGTLRAASAGLRRLGRVGSGVLVRLRSRAAAIWLAARGLLRPGGEKERPRSPGERPDAGAAPSPASPPTAFRWHADLQLLVASEPGMRFRVEGVHRVRVPVWVQQQLRQAGFSVVTMWGNRMLGAVMARWGARLPGGAPAPPDWTALPVGRWLSARWDAWIPVVEPGTTEVLLGRYDAWGRYTGRWRVVVAPDGAIAEQRWIPAPSWPPPHRLSNTRSGFALKQPPSY